MIMPTAHQLIAWPRHDTPLGDICYGGVLEGAGGTGFETFRTLGLHALVLLWRGRGAYFDRSGHGQRLEAGDMILITPDLPHQYGPDAQEDWHEIYICFRGESLIGQFGSLRRAAGGPVLHLGEPLKWRERLLAILQDPPTRFPNAVARMSLFQVCLADLVSAAAKRSMACDDWIAEAIALLAWSELPLPEIARRCGLSYSSFRRHFRAQTGNSPGSVRQDARLEKAGLLLERTQLPIAEIAVQCGFHDGAHFSNCFSKHYRIAPSSWRKTRVKPASQDQ